ncbi:MULTISPECIES: hypothetical protein [Halomonas]|uniref:Uncharacterized protein n=1 Tax=Halomonas flagellata TaxID=2920385 RepID=A0ABS9RRQ7_9GAMM|nr:MULTISPECIES: hypothetical protein [Halomonas]MCH4562538.1 hypothetical protein [Halomonas flagellata]
MALFRDKVMILVSAAGDDWRLRYIMGDAARFRPGDVTASGLPGAVVAGIPSVDTSVSPILTCIRKPRSS